MIKDTRLKWLQLILSASLPACSSSPMSLGSGTDEVVSSTNGNDDDEGSHDMPSSDDGSPTMGGCELDGVHYEEGEELPQVDCNTLWCQGGNIATTMIDCSAGLDECERILTECRESGTSMTCAEDYNLCLGQEEPVDMCEAAVQMCIDGGEDAMTCANRYNCDGDPPTPSECDTLQAECFMNNGTMCDELFEQCLEQMAAPEEDMCQAAIDLCVAAGESLEACQMRYAGCGLLPTPEECADALSSCQSGPMPVECEETYDACMAVAKPRTLAECEALLESCRNNGMSTTCADDFNACLASVVE